MDNRQAIEHLETPSLPAVAHRLIDLCRNETANVQDFAALIKTDAGLAGRLLQVANSAYYARRDETTTIERAVSVLGLKYVKSVALGFHLAAVLIGLKEVGFDERAFWEQSLLRAVLARQLAGRYCPARREEAFLVGLLQDCGIPVLMQHYGAEYAALWSQGDVSHAGLARMERQLYKFDHTMAARLIAERWRLPELLSAAIRNHHHHGPAEASSNELEQLLQVSYFVGAVPLAEKPVALCQQDLTVLFYAHRVFGLDLPAVRKMLAATGAEFAATATLFGGILPQQLTAERLLTQAQRLLGKLAGDEVKANFDMERQLARLRGHCDNLLKQKVKIAQQASTDSLTGLVTRDGFEAFLEQACSAVEGGAASLAVLFVDLDDFKSINDRWGHRVGDRCLTKVAQMLQEHLPEEACVGRYGGDEMVAAVTGTTLKDVLARGKALVEQLGEAPLPVRKDDNPDGRRLGCSVGLLFCEEGARPGHPSRVMELADHQMYRAKGEGKGQLCYDVMGAEAVRQKPSA